MKTTDAAKGNWQQILTEVGNVDAAYLDGKHHGCPKDGRGRDRFRFDNKDGRGTFFCGCGAGDGMDLLRCCTGKDFPTLAGEIDTLLGNVRGKPEPRPLSPAERLRASALPSKRSAYLASRGLEVPPGLLFARNVAYFDGVEQVGTYDAILAPITRDGRWVTFHCTYLHRGRKAPVPAPRKILPGRSSPIGGGVELYPAAEEMGVAEGIETAIAASMMFGVPVHAALNTALLAKWRPPAVAKCIHIYADHDENAAGHAAAWALCHRLRMTGLTAHVVLPESPGTDWNDILLNGNARAA